MSASIYRATIPGRVAGIPCLIGVLTYHKVPPWKGSVHTCPSDWDWRGYTECEFDILDQRGRRAPWLENKLDDNVRQLIEGEIAEAMDSAAEELGGPDE